MIILNKDFFEVFVRRMDELDERAATPNLSSLSQVKKIAVGAHYHHRTVGVCSACNR